MCVFFLDVVFCGRTVLSRRTDCQETVHMKTRRNCGVGNVKDNERRLCGEMREAERSCKGRG
jgi:hypothetical protein